MNTTKLESHGAVAGQVERGVKPHAEKLARRLQQAAYCHGYEDGHPSNATTRQAKTDAASRQALANLLIAIAALANGAPPRDPHRGGSSYEASMLRNLLAKILRDGGHYVEEHGLDKALEDAEAKIVQWLALGEVIGLAYGHLWMVNNEPGTPRRYPPERAAYEARKLLRDTMTHNERGEFINRVIAQVRDDLGA